VEMPGLWKAWKAKSRLPTLSTSPLEISPTAGEIPTFPQRRRRGRMEKWKTKSRFSTFPPPRFLSPKRKHKSRRRASPAPARALGARIQASSQGGPRRNARALRALMFHRKDQRKETSRRSIISGSPRIGIEGPFQAHLALESIFDFRLICGLENAPTCLDRGIALCAGAPIRKFCPVTAAVKPSLVNNRGGSSLSPKLYELLR
jgi:hypothetical protein